MISGSEQGNPGFEVDTKTGPDILPAHVPLLPCRNIRYLGSYIDYLSKFLYTQGKCIKGSDGGFELTYGKSCCKTSNT